MGYQIGVGANLLVIVALGLHHWLHPSPENRPLALLAVPLLFVLARWVRTGIGEPLISPNYRALRRVGHRIGVFFVWMALVGALWVFPVFVEIAQGSKYLYISGAFVTISAFLFALGFLIVEVDMFTWRRSVT